MAGSYEDAVSELLANGPELAVFLRFNLDSITRLAAALGNPERRLLAVLIAGTNGKGSTAATLAGIVQAAGYRTGLYTSPHLLQINERIQINQEPISNAEFAEIYDRVQSASLQLIQRGTLSSHPSFFEMLTAMMFEYFASAGVELAIVEAGMGGTDDATNIVDPILSIITDVDFDHEDYLGKTLREIAAKKSGIIRSNAPVVLLPQHPEVNDTLGNAILEKNARPVSATKHMPPLTPGSHNYFAHKANQVPRAVFPLLFMGKEILVNSPLVGRHQLRNIALAITAAEQLNSCGYKILPTHVEEGTQNTKWPARFQVFLSGADFPEAVLDVAHNPAGAWALRSTLSALYADRLLTLIFGCMRDKHVKEIIQILFPCAERVIVTRADHPRAMPARDIALAAEDMGVMTTTAETVREAVKLARSMPIPGEVLVITGSFPIVKDGLELLR
ncbi:MAG: bifunctional folylpolyglutamate synthase/dihydrofolate synthase [Candidatus Angelobacter sp. Gp1-AA117]|nr:MAG: bifunctional folylpolyglutamate synthase/dihydrofolate synthase [Candidatus Angelobacter sp. Gp1-AA117]